MIETGLSKEEMDHLWERYQNQENIKTLISEFKLNIHANQFLHIFPPVMTDISCPYCAKEMLRERNNRRTNKNATGNMAYCPLCAHDESPYCKCAACYLRQIERHRLQQEEKLAMVNRRHATPPPASEHALATASLPSLMACILVDLPPQSQPIAPNDSLERWAQQAMEENILSLDLAHCSLDAFTATGEIAIDTLLAYKSNVMISSPPLEQGQKASYILEKLQNPHSEWKKTPTAIKELWLDIAQAECLDFLQKQLDERHFHGLRIPDQIAPNLRAMLVKKPTAILFAIILFAVKEVIDDYQKTSSKTKQAALNKISYFLDKKFELTIKENSNIHPYSSGKPRSRSKANEIFVNDILKEAGDYCYNNSVTAWLNRQKTTQPNGTICCPNCSTDTIGIIQTDCQIFLSCQECEQETVYILR